MRRSSRRMQTTLDVGVGGVIAIANSSIDVTDSDPDADPEGKLLVQPSPSIPSHTSWGRLRTAIMEKTTSFTDKRSVLNIRS